MVVTVNPINIEATDDWISQSEAARLRGITRQAIAHLVDRGRLSVFEIAGRKLVRRSEVMAFDRLPAGRKPKK